MKFAEMHCHSKYVVSLEKMRRPESLVEPEDLLKTAYQKGLSAVAITDHNTMEGNLKAQKVASKYNLIVIPAEEFDTDARHNGQILGYGIKPGIQPFRQPEEIIMDIKKSGGIAIIPHPFDFVRGLKKMSRRNFQMADGLEILNHGAFNNGKTQNLAKQFKNKIVTGGSDAHCRVLLGSVVLGFPDYCRKADDYVGCLKKGDYIIRARRWYYYSMFLGGLNYIRLNLLPVFKRLSISENREG